MAASMAVSMSASEDVITDDALGTEELEIDLLLEAIFRRFGFDFRAYDRPGVTAKLQALMAERELATVSQLQDRVLHDGQTGPAVLRALSVQPVLLFCDFAQVQRLRRMGARNRIARTNARPRVPTVPQRAQSIGAR